MIQGVPAWTALLQLVGGGTARVSVALTCEFGAVAAFVGMLQLRDLIAQLRRFFVAFGLDRLLEFST